MFDQLQDTAVSAQDEAKKFFAAANFYMSLTKKAGRSYPKEVAGLEKTAGPLSSIFSKVRDVGTNVGRGASERAGMFTTGMLNRESKLRGARNIIKNKGKTGLDLSDEGGFMNRMRERWKAVKYPEYRAVHDKARDPIRKFEAVFGSTPPTNPKRLQEWRVHRQNAVQKMHDLKNVFKSGKEVGEGSGATDIINNMRRMMPQGGMATPTGIASALLRSGSVTPESFISAGYKLKGTMEGTRAAAKAAKQKRNIIIGSGVAGGAGLAALLAHRRKQRALPPAGYSNDAFA